MRIGWLGGGAFVAVLCLGGRAQADWPSARHDPQRTGVSQASSDITKPAVYWKAYVGGNVDPQGFLTADVDKDGTPDVVYVAGNSVVATRADGTPLWRTLPRTYQTLSAIDDFDGDGLPDVLVAGQSQAFLLAGKDGSIEWSEDASDFGTLGGLRVTDLNSDGRPDVLAEECHCCGVNNGASGYAFSFARKSGAVTASKLWTLPAATDDFYSCGVPSVVFDGNGDGQPEIAHAGGSHVYVLGSDGSMLVGAAQSPALGDLLYDGDCLPANVDGTPGEELVCFQKQIAATDPASLRQVYVLHLDTTTTPASLDLLWRNTTLADQGGTGDLDYEPNAVVDLDGNGTLEVVVSGMASTGSWTTYVFDARTGATLATIPNARTAGTATLRSDGSTNLLTTDGKNLTVWTYTPTGATPVRAAWTQTDRRTLTGVDSSLLRAVRANLRLITPDLNQDGLSDLLTSTVSPGTVLYDYSAASGAPIQVATFVFPTDVDPVATWLAPPTTRSYPQVATAANDGILRVFDNNLEPTTPLRAGGFCGGGWQHSPVVASLAGTGGTQSAFVTDSRGALLRFDAQNASLAAPPQAQWALRNCASPSVFKALDGAKSGIVCRGAQQPVSYPVQPALSAVRGDGSLIWNAPLPGSGAINDALPGSVDASGVPAVLVQTADTASNVSTMAFSGSTGAEIWTTTPTAIRWGTYSFSAADWDGDGVTDVVTILNNLQAISGVGGQTLAAGTAFFAYGVPILEDVDGNGLVEATLQGGYYPARTLEHDLVTPTWVGSNTEPYQMGAIAACPAGPQLVEGSALSPSRIYLTQVAGSSPGSASSFVLAGGNRYVSESAASAAGAYLATLSDVSIETNLTGNGGPSAVVGSSDGWVYLLDACSGTIQSTLALGESVCGAVFGDTNADGHDEVLVSTSGGYVYDIQNEELGGCGPVLDVDPPHGTTDKEVSQVVTESTLFGAWQPVQGAASYEAAVTHEPEGIISDPPWQDVGNVTSAAVTGLPLVAGQTYYFAVRAVGPPGKSVDALSTGVTVIGAGDGTPDAGSSAAGNGSATGTGPSSGSGPPSTASPSASSGCGCTTARAAPADGLAVGASVGILLCWLRRRRRRRAGPDWPPSAGR